MNLIAIAVFFDMKTNKSILNHFFVIKSVEDRFFGLVLTNFDSIETDGNCHYLN